MQYSEKTAALATDPADYVLSDGKPDRHGDIIVQSGWQLDEFSPVALFNHHRDAIVGRWDDLKVKAGRLVGRLVLSTSDDPVAKMVRALIADGMLETVSVGFRPLDYEPVDPKDPYGPQRYKKNELLEASLVSVPANPRARRIAKDFCPETDIDRLFSVPAENGNHRTGKPAATPRLIQRSAAHMTATLPIGKRIEAGEARLVQLKDEMTRIDGEIAEAGTPTDEQAQQVDVLRSEIDIAEKNIATLRKIEASLVVKAGKSAIVVPAEAKKTIAPRDFLVRAATVHFLAKMQQRPIEAVLNERYPGDEGTGMVLKAAVAPAATTVAGWAQELVGTSIADFLNQLAVVSIYPQLAALGPKFTFGRFGIIKVPGRSPTPKINGSFVGEGQPIPVRKAGLTSITLTPKKMAVISEFTREMAQHSTPSIESVIRQAMNEDTAEAIDTVLIDATAADAIRPAGLRNGVTGLTPSVLTTTFEKMVADIKALIAPIVAARGGRSLVLLMNPAQQLSLGWVTTPSGDFVFASAQDGQLRGIKVIASTTVPAGMLIMLDAADFTSATGDTPEFDVSDVATIHEEDTTPLPIGTPGSPPTIAAPTRSLWQTASIGVRMILDMNWAMRRTGQVSWMTGVTW